jgi:hypothetical protein
VAEPSLDKAVIKAIGPLIITAIGAVIGWLPGGLTGAIGQPLTALLTAVGAISGLVFSLMYKRYLGVLDASAHDRNPTDRNAHAERQAYDALRKSLRGGNIAASLYTDWLTKFLDGVDRFFGDASKAHQTLFPGAFGLKTPAPLWTAPALDRCLLLALVYPIAAIFIVWAVSGHVGPAEKALWLPPASSVWMRGLAVTVIGTYTFALRRLVRSSRISIVSVTVVLTLAIALSLALSLAGARVPYDRTVGHIALAVSFTAFLTAYATVILDRGVGAVAVAAAITVAVANRDVSAAAFAAAVPVAVAAVPGAVVAVTAIGVVAWLSHTAARARWQGGFLPSFLVAMSLGCLVAAHYLSSFPRWDECGPLLLFLGLLTLLNAPFDWVSLGLTRALLRRGLELGGWWPYFLALADALAAALIIALLALTMVIGVQTFDHLAEHSGRADARVLPLDKLFDGIAAHPAAPEYWWVYALLLSTMIPSLLNLMIGGASLLRGIPGLPTLLLRFMPASKAVPAFDRTWLALVLTCQVFVGDSSASRRSSLWPSA